MSQQASKSHNLEINYSSEQTPKHQQAENLNQQKSNNKFLGFTRTENNQAAEGNMHEAAKVRVGTPIGLPTTTSSPDLKGLLLTSLNF
jgi:hypothetical protein